MKRNSRLWIAAAGILLSFGVLLLSGSAAPGPAASRTPWDIRMTVKASGKYGLEGRSRATGNYRLACAWTGGLQQDEDDYVLLQGQSTLEEWEAEESLVGPAGVRVLTTSDFDEIPELRVAYVLRRGGGLHISFIVRGFGVPKSLADGLFYLHLPASAENEERPDGLNYNSYVIAGSNDIVLDDPSSFPGPQEKTFCWTWLRRAVVSERDRGLFSTNRHEVEVTICVSPAK